jgi:hypothetical protein
MNWGKDKVLGLSRRYGEFDGGLSWLNATRFYAYIPVK